MMPQSILTKRYFGSVRMKTRRSLPDYVRKEGWESETIEMVPPTGIEPVFPP